MPFDFNKQPLKIYGIWPQTPFPLEVSIYGYCQMACFYCFANLNRDAGPERGADYQRNTTQALFTYMAREEADPMSPIGFFLREKYPICFSNVTDPFQREEKTHRSSEAFMQWAYEKEIPLFVQTKGNVLYEDFDRYADLLVPGKDVVYMSITAQDDKVRRKIEPGALAIEKRWELAKMLTDRGIPVVAACNPYLREWVPDTAKYADDCISAGIHGIWWMPLHFNDRQMPHVPKFYAKYLPKGNLMRAFVQQSVREWYQECDRTGLDFFPSPYWDAFFGYRGAYSECAPAELTGGKQLSFEHDLRKELHEFHHSHDASYTVIRWEQIASWVAAKGVPNPTLRTNDFWMPFNAKIKADRNLWRQELGKENTFYNVLRYFWNHPWECNLFLWVDPATYILADGERGGKPIYAADDNGDLIGVKVNKPRLDRVYHIDQTLMAEDEIVDWDGVPMLSATS